MERGEVQVADVVVSYKSDERAAVAFIVTMLQAAGFDVWWDKKLEAGSSYDTSIVSQISQAKCVLVVWSHASVRSDWVRGEASLALQQEKFVPVRLDDVQLPPPFSMKHTLDLRSWLGHPLHPQWWEVIGAVRAKVDPSRRSSIAAKDYEHRALRAVGHHIHKLKAKDSTGRWAYYFILVTPHNEQRFLRVVEGDGIVDMDEYGMVIASNFGETPSDEIRRFLSERYGFVI